MRFLFGHFAHLGSRCFPVRRLLSFTFLIVAFFIGGIPSIANQLTVTRFDDPAPDGCLPTDCSLREAILDTNATSGEDQIVLPAGFYTVTLSVPLEISDSLTIMGSSLTDTVLSGYYSTPIFLIHNGTVALESMTIRGGYGSGVQQQRGSLTIENCLIQWNYASPSGSGGGIYSQGSLTVTNSIIANNSAVNNGGGIYAGGKLLVVNSIISDNEAGNGGGIYATNFVGITGTTVANNWATAYDPFTQGAGGGIYGAAGATITIFDVWLADNQSTYDGAGISSRGILSVTSSIISGNQSGMSGGGIENDFGSIFVSASTFLSNTANNAGGGIVNNGAAIIKHSAFLGNTRGGIFTSSQLSVTNSTIAGSTVLGGIYSASPTGVVNLNNVTIAHNTGYGLYHFSGSIHSQNSLLTGNTPADCTGTLNSQGYNLIQSPGACVISGETTGNIIGTSPVLGPLQDNGGATLTYALLASSPAIDSANPGTCESTDQRGAVRADGAGRGGLACDIGAYEYASNETPSVISLKSFESKSAVQMPMGIVLLVLCTSFLYLRQRRSRG